MIEMTIRNSLVTPLELDTLVRERGLKFGLRSFQASAIRALEDWVSVNAGVTDTHKDGSNGNGSERSTFSLDVSDLPIWAQELLADATLRIREGLQSGPSFTNETDKHKGKEATFAAALEENERQLALANEVVKGQSGNASGGARTKGRARNVARTA